MLHASHRTPHSAAVSISISLLEALGLLPVVATAVLSRGGGQPPSRLGARMITPQTILGFAEGLDNYCTAHGIDPDDDVVTETTKVVAPTALPVGAGVINMLTGKRAGKGGTWYKEALERLVVEYCEEQEVQQANSGDSENDGDDNKGARVHERYVTNGNNTAAKDQYGDCIQALDGDEQVYAEGLCERVASCYWEAPRTNTARNRRYTEAEYHAAQDASREHIDSIAVHYGSVGVVLAVAVFVGCAKFTIKRYFHELTKSLGSLRYLM